MTRAEHLQWCKDRALAYLPGDPREAVTSMIADLRKHPELENHGAIMLTLMMMLGGHLNTADEARKHIEGFN